VLGDLTRPETLASAMKGVEAVYLMISGEDSAVMELARKEGVDHVVLLSSQTVETHPGNAIALRHLRAEESVRHSGVPWTFLRPGQFASNALQWAQVVRDRGIVRAPFAEVALPAVHPADIAAVAVAALTRKGHKGQVYPITGPEAITPPEQVRVLASVLGRELVFEEISVEQAKKSMHAPAVIVDAVFDVIGSATEQDAQVLPTVENVTGLRARTFEQWAWDNRAAFVN
jgi:uncharacterized protein YbjT (DUF2867 family)